MIHGGFAWITKTWGVELSNKRNGDFLSYRGGGKWGGGNEHRDGHLKRPPSEEIFARAEDRSNLGRMRGKTGSSLRVRGAGGVSRAFKFSTPRVGGRENKTAVSKLIL